MSVKQMKTMPTARTIHEFSMKKEMYECAQRYYITFLIYFILL